MQSGGPVVFESMEAKGIGANPEIIDLIGMPVAPEPISEKIKPGKPPGRCHRGATNIIHL